MPPANPPPYPQAGMDDPGSLGFLHDTMDMQEMAGIGKVTVEQLAERTRQQQKTMQMMLQQITHTQRMLDQRLAVLEREQASDSGRMRTIATEVVDKEHERNSSKLERKVERLTDDVDNLGKTMRERFDEYAKKADFELLRQTVQATLQGIGDYATKAWAKGEFGELGMTTKHDQWLGWGAKIVVGAVLMGVVALVVNQSGVLPG